MVEDAVLQQQEEQSQVKNEAILALIDATSSSYQQQINAGSTRDESVSSVLNLDSDELNLDAVAASKRYQSKYHGDFNE
ncbi:unnamed protein product [Peronospora farinosa]|uniref:Uncharacterized protein n=1 Tax=Peronospora farinosa TaxID=134698 RepID=A0AAV0THP1_9STRA|nr:unnamed protein product [Peronospora farinosa]CAI5719685.1 unnamed protein product [Peronospora farinosa]